MPLVRRTTVTKAVPAKTERTREYEVYVPPAEVSPEDQVIPYKELPERQFAEVKAMDDSHGGWPIPGLQELPREPEPDLGPPAVETTPERIAEAEQRADEVAAHEAEEAERFRPIEPEEAAPTATRTTPEAIAEAEERAEAVEAHEESEKQPQIPEELEVPTATRSVTTPAPEGFAKLNAKAAVKAVHAAPEEQLPAMLAIEKARSEPLWPRSTVLDAFKDRGLE